MLVSCRTNLDVVGEQWPKRMDYIPRVGDLIQSATKHGNFQLRLKVVRVTWKPFQEESMLRSEWVPEIELHDFQDRSIQEFYEWYAPLVGKTVASFI